MAELNQFKFFIGKKLFARRFKAVAAAGNIQGPVLDIGAGSKPFRRFLVDTRVVTVDIQADLRPDLAAAVSRLPFKDGTYTSAICTEVLEHVADPGPCLAEIRRVLKPRGVLYLTVPMLWPLHYEPHDYYRYTPYSLRYLLEKNGFEVVEIEAIGGFFSFVFMRLGEKLFNLIHKSAFFLPKSKRWIWSVPLTLPLFYILYLLSLILDPLMKKDVFAWSVLAHARHASRGR